MINEITKVAVAAAKEAGRTLKREYERFDRGTIKLKSHHEVITRSDLRSEEILIRHIKENFPAHSILSEEVGRVKGSPDYLWVIDPIDGTTNFTMHNPLWAISIGVAHQDELVAGVIFAPMLDELYVAQADGGANLNGDKIEVSGVKDGKVLNAFCNGRDPKYVKRAIRYFSAQKLGENDCRQLGSAALELAYVAAGRLESVVIPGANPWDIAAGVLLVREAGGRVTDFTGKEWRLDHENMVASNGLVHRETLRVLAK